MAAMNWAGKNFSSAEDVQPIMVYDDKGGRRYAEEISGGPARVSIQNNILFEVDQKRISCWWNDMV